MNFLIICKDIKNSGEIRKNYLQPHLDYVETVLNKIQVAGPLLNDNKEMTSSCFIYNAQSKEQALQLLHEDPYYKAGLYEHVSISEFRAVAGNWVGGKNW